MRKLLIFAIVSVVLFTVTCASAEITELKVQQQYDSVLPDSNSALAIHFKMQEGWHFYADKKTAPNGMVLTVVSSGEAVEFSAPIYPPAVLYFDKNTKKKQKVFSNSFIVYLPFKAGSILGETEIKIQSKGLACSDRLCSPSNYELTERMKISSEAAMAQPAFSLPDKIASPFSAGIILPLAILAGILLNVMPCVWPILPIIVMRIVTQAKESRARAIALGLAFAVGIVLFFGALALANIVLKLSFGIVFQWGDQLRNPAVVIATVALLVALAMFMFGVFSFGIPASVSSKPGQGKGFAGSVGMGFMAAVLSTPCSFAILTFVLAWAQTQTLTTGTITILLIGIGMSLPYIILTSMPKLLAKIPKPGKWMELFKHGTGFLLLAIAVKMAEAIPAGKLINVLYYVVILGICLWIWGQWVSYNDRKTKKFFVRLIAVIIAIAAGLWFLQAPKADLVDWQKYDAAKIAQAQQENRPILIKFTADWCFSCKVLDKTVYSRKIIADLIRQKNVLSIKADTTQWDYPAAKALKDMYNEPAVPVTVLLLPGRTEPIKLRGTLIGNKLKDHLENLPDKKIDDSTE